MLLFLVVTFQTTTKQYLSEVMLRTVVTDVCVSLFTIVSLMGPDNGILVLGLLKYICTTTTPETGAFMLCAPVSNHRYTHNVIYMKRVKRRSLLNTLLRRRLTKRRSARAALYLRVTSLWTVLNRAYWNQPQQVARFIQTNTTRYGRLCLQQTSLNMFYNIVQDGKMFHAHLACKHVHNFLYACRCRI